MLALFVTVRGVRILAGGLVALLLLGAGCASEEPDSQAPASTQAGVGGDLALPTTAEDITCDEILSPEDAAAALGVERTEVYEVVEPSEVPRLRCSYDECECKDVTLTFFGDADRAEAERSIEDMPIQSEIGGRPAGSDDGGTVVLFPSFVLAVDHTFVNLLDDVVANLNAGGSSNT